MKKRTITKYERDTNCIWGMLRVTQRVCCLCTVLPGATLPCWTTPCSWWIHGEAPQKHEGAEAFAAERCWRLFWDDEATQERGRVWRESVRLPLASMPSRAGCGGRWMVKGCLVVQTFPVAFLDWGWKVKKGSVPNFMRIVSFFLWL